MSKSIKKKLTALMVVGIMAVPMVSYGQDKAVLISEHESVSISEKAEMKNEMIKYEGTISEIMESNGNISINVNSDTKEELDGMVFHIGEIVSLWDSGTEELIKAEDLKEGMMVQVFFHEHTPMTMSIPPQLTPSKVLVLTEKDLVEDEVVDEEVEEVREMIALRDLASQLAYKVQWNNEDKTVELTKMNQTIVIKLGQFDYTLNKSLGKFTKAPELRNGSLYVSASVLEFMN